jgi:PEGA domain
MRSVSALFLGVLTVLGATHAVFPASALAGQLSSSRTTGSSARERLAVVRFDVRGNVPPALGRELGDRLVEGLAAVSFEVLKPGADAPSPVADREGEACRDEGCYRRVAKALNVHYLVSAQIEERQKTFEITLELLSARTGSVVGTNRERCEICGVVEVGEKMFLAASTLRARLEALARAPARFVIRTVPSGAAVTIDGKPMGVTPLDVTLAAGERRLLIEREGYSPLERNLSVTRGVDEALDLDLVQLPTKFPFKAAGWTAVATGAALAAGGIYLLALHGSEVSCSPSEKDDFNHCPEVYKTNLIGAGLLGTSAVVATLGGVWLYLAQPASGGLLSGERAGLTLGAKGRF